MQKKNGTGTIMQETFFAEYAFWLNIEKLVKQKFSLWMLLSII